MTDLFLFAGFERSSMSIVLPNPVLKVASLDIA